MVISLTGAVWPGGSLRAQETSGDFSGGSMKIGFDNRACDSSLEGAIRYNSGGGGADHVRVFVTSSEWRGDAVGGLSGANAKCQAAADAESLGGTWLAWLSTDAANDPESLFTHHSLPYKMVDGTTIASDWADLTDGSGGSTGGLLTGIQLTESGALVDGDGLDTVWTGTLGNGTSTGTDCGDFASTSGSGTQGTSTSYIGDGWTDTTDSSCFGTAHLYCFESALTTGGGGDFEVCTTGEISGLIHHWPLDESPAGGTFADSAGTADASIGGGTVVSIAGQIGNAVSLTNDDNINAPASAMSDIQGVSQLTISAWMKRSAAGQPVSVGNLEDPEGGIEIQLWTDGNFYCSFSDNSFIEAYYALNDTNWHHLACVYDGTQTGNTNRVKGYVDGQPITFDGFNGTIPASVYAGPLPFYIGPYPTGSWSVGDVDDVRIYNRPLTATEIGNIFNKTSSYVWQGLNE